MTDISPKRTDVNVDTYALVIHEEGQILYRYENPPLGEDQKWNKKRKLNHGEAPTLELGSTKVRQRTSDDGLQVVVLYTTDLKISNSGREAANDESATEKRETAANDESATEKRETAANDESVTDDDSYQGYVIELSDGTGIPQSNTVTHTDQRENMGEVVDYLVTECHLLNEIDIPYSRSGAYSNCMINSKPVHPDGDIMGNQYSLTGGYHLETKLNIDDKKKQIEHLAKQVGLSVEFFGKWHDSR
jgi:hypothetical protein